MKCIKSLVYLAGLAVAAPNGKRSDFVSFESIHGPVSVFMANELDTSNVKYVDRREAMLKQYLQNTSSKLAAKVKFEMAYDSLRTSEKCSFPLNFVFIQDTTGEEKFHARNLVKQLANVPGALERYQDNEEENNNNWPQNSDGERFSPNKTPLGLAMSRVQKYHPDSKFAFISFRDHQMHDLGEAGDFCVRENTGFTDSFNGIYSGINNIIHSGGGDAMENQFGAVFHGMSMLNSLGLSHPFHSKAVILLSDSMPHFAEDGLKPAGMHAFPGVYSEHTYCNNFYYPGASAIRYHLNLGAIHKAIMVYDNDHWNNAPFTNWKWFNEYNGGSKNMLQSIESPEKFWIHFREIVREIEIKECGKAFTDIFDEETSTLPSSQTIHSSDSVSTNIEQEVESTHESHHSSSDSVNPPGPHPDDCMECPEVLIKLAKRPAKMDLVVTNQ